MIDAFLTWLGLKWGSVVGGFVGAMCSLKLFADLAPWKRVTTVLFGWAMASFITPLIVEWVGMNERHLVSVGFLVGLLGLSIAYNVFKAIPEWVTGARALIMGKLGGSKGD